MQDPKKEIIYKIDGHLWTEELSPNYPVIKLSNNFGTASIALHGAHVIQYTPAHQKPVIFTSKEAVYKEGKAIRGGIPICWPWFNAHPTDNSLPSHGYARTQFWEIIKSNHSETLTSVTLELIQNNLRARTTISLGKSLEISLTTTNLSKEKQTIGGALHTYFEISDISKISINGLEKSHYIDTLTETKEHQLGTITINQEIDNIYTDTNQSIQISDPDWNRCINITKSGSQSTVVWNPWIEKSANMTDLGNAEYNNFVCVEAANAREDVYELLKGESHTLATKITSIENQ